MTQINERDAIARICDTIVSSEPSSFFSPNSCSKIKSISSQPLLTQLFAFTTKSSDVEVRRLAILSLTIVFNDVLPYDQIVIRDVKSQTQLLTKGIRDKRRWDTQMLNAYNRFVSLLENGVIEVFGKVGRSSPLLPHSSSIQFGLGVLGCVGELLSKRPIFNNHERLGRILVRRCFQPFEPVQRLCVEQLKRVFGCDMQGELSSFLVLSINEEIAQRCASRTKKEGKIPLGVAESLLEVRIDLSGSVREFSERKNDQPQQQKRKRKAEEDEKLKNPLTRTDISEEQSTIIKRSIQEGNPLPDYLSISQCHSSSVHQMTLIVLRVLERASFVIHLLPPLLSLLRKTARFLNRGVVEEVLVLFRALIREQEESGEVNGDVLLPLIHTSFLLLSTLSSSSSTDEEDQSHEMVNVDEIQFISCLYSLLTPSLLLEEESLEKLLDSISFSFVERREIRLVRVGAFVHKLGRCLHEIISNTSNKEKSGFQKAILGVVMMIRMLCHHYPEMRSILNISTKLEESEEELVGSGILNLDNGNPDFSNAMSNPSPFLPLVVEEMASGGGVLFVNLMGKLRRGDVLGPADHYSTILKLNQQDIIKENQKQELALQPKKKKQKKKKKRGGKKKNKKNQSTTKNT